MKRKWLRLIAYLSLAAYLLVNTQAAEALSTHFQFVLSQPSQNAPNSCKGQGREADHSRKDAPARTCSSCKHCAKQKQKVSHPPDQEGTDHDHASPEPSCPCCPDGPGDRSSPSCPCPGGCAFCTVAKVPCLTTLTLSVGPSPCVGESAAEQPFCYVGPCRGGLIRPPRV
jgi:hypothetical protein